MEKADFCPHCNFLPHSFSFCLSPPSPPPPSVLPPSLPPPLFLSPPPPSGQNSLWVWGLMDGLFSSTCVFRQAGGETGRAEVFQAVCAVTKTCCCLSGGGEWIPTSGGRKLNTDEKGEETFSCRSVTVMPVWGTVFEIWLKQSRTSTCLRMWTDPSVYSAGNSTRTCWAFFLFLQQCKRGSGLREFPARLIQP